ncbi:MAG: M1 family metallopeptidase [Candidatus Nomurabacteria bacterium]|jgi:aminopeptidase N|nr:M1 family metallopeptidase [Candidatus Nomurabacteria bacterium]
METFLDYFTPEKYQLSLDISNDQLLGCLTIRGITKSKIVKLHAKNITDITVADYAWTQKDDHILIQNLPKNQQIILKITFTSQISAQMHGAYLSKYNFNGKENHIITTQFESHFARECFPCIDEPAAKAIFELTLKHDKNLTALSNTPVAKSESSATFTTTTFEPTPKMSTYLLAFVVGEFNKIESKNNHNIKITSYAPLNQPKEKLLFANEVACKSLDFYADKFGINYPLPKLDQVALPDFEAGAMENWGLVTYRESMFLCDENSSIETKKSVALVVAHELSHQWFGNLVTMKWWDDLWLNESFATMIEYLCVEKLFPQWQIMDDFFLNERTAAMNRDAIAGVQTIKQDIKSPDEIQTLFDGAIVYAKGACLMYMLKDQLGDDNFFSGLQDYFQKFAYCNTVGDDLWQSLQPYANFNIADFMNQWLTQPNYPIIQNGKIIPITDAGQTWTIPKISDDLSGYYLIQNNCETFATQTHQQKMRTLLDLTILTKYNKTPSLQIFNILEQLSPNEETVLWQLATNLLSNLRIFIEPETAEEKHFQSFVNNLLEPKYQKLGLKSTQTEQPAITEFRQTVIAWLLYAKNQTVINDLLAEYHENFEQIPAELRDNILFTKLRFNFSQDLYDKYLAEYRTTHGPELKDDLASALTSAIKNPENITQNLNLMQDFTIIRQQDTLHWFASLLRNFHARSKTWHFLQENWSWFEQNFGNDGGLNYYPMLVAHVLKTPKQLADYSTFFAPMKQEPYLERAIKMGENEISDRITLITDNQPQILQYLNK